MEVEPTEATERWNDAYRTGIAALGERDLDNAERSFCLAAGVARSFDDRDVRLAETLDELGLVSYLRGDYGSAEQFQGAAAAEMLLARGPEGRSGAGIEGGTSRSSVDIYLARLGHIFERQGRDHLTAELREQPTRVLALGYLPLDRNLAMRLDWLISRLLLEEDFAAADAVSTLRQEILAMAP